MLHNDAFGLLVGAVVLGAVHGIEPGHGWPVAAAYALDQSNKWFYGLASSLILGVGHLVSSLAMVAVFFYARSYFGLTQLNQSITLFEGVRIGGPVSLVAGALLIVLGIREYVSHGGGHGHTETHQHGHDDHHDTHHADHAQSDHQHDAHHADHEHEQPHDPHRHDSHRHDHQESSSGILAWLKELLTGGGHSHDHAADDFETASNRGLLGIAWFAFLLGFAHEEEFEIIGMCVGSNYCLELMSVYALAVIVGIVALTMLLVAGYTRYEQRVERYTPYLPVFSAAVLILMGLGFITGLY